MQAKSLTVINASYKKNPSEDHKNSGGYLNKKHLIIQGPFIIHH
jgi:hypothetical protein